jgi:hypothetical protein
MAMYKYKLYFFVGPVAVGQVTDAIRLFEPRVVAGTEHLWVEWEGENADGAADSFCARLREQAGTDFGIELKGFSGRVVFLLPPVWQVDFVDSGSDAGSNMERA